MKKYVFISLLFLFACATRVRAQAGRAYATIGDVKITALSNGIQIRVGADGILQYKDVDTNGLKMQVLFPAARNGTKKNFLNVDQYPVSYVQLSTPPNSTGGLGVLMQINNLIATNATLTATPDGKGVLWTIQSDRTVETRAVKTSATVPGESNPETSTQVEWDGKLLSLRAVRADIHALMGAIARRTGVSVAVDDAVDRKISLSLKDIAPEDAIRAVSTAYGLALSQINGIYMLSEGVPTDLATYHLSGTQSYRMQNTQAQTASGLLPNFLYSYVKVNPEQNAVVVTAPSQMLAKIGADLQKVDVPSPQISIEAIAVELSDATTRDLGISFGNPDRASFSSVDPSAGQITYSTIGKLPRLFNINLRALEASGKARVRARPQMAVVNGRTANIFIGAQRFILTQVNQFGQTQTRIQSVDVGVKLNVTPLTGGNGEITTRLAPQVSNITELDSQTGLPVLSTRGAETTVRVKDGETIVIGGLTLSQEESTRGKIPLLGDLPFIGGVFRSRKNSTVRTELVIFVTPRILPQSITPQDSTAPALTAPALTAPALTAPTSTPAVPTTPTAPLNAGP